MSISDHALAIHEKMMEDPTHMYSQTELELLLPTGARQQLIEFVQQLMNNHMVKLSQAQDTLFYQPVSKSDAERIKGLSADEAMVYSHIQAAGREGIWSKAIKSKTNLHQHVVIKCLKSLENSRHIKSVKSIKSPTRKIYMLYELQPSIEVTGGPWFTDSELDTEFVELLARLTWQYITEKTYPSFQETHLQQESSVPGRSDYPTLETIHDFIGNSGVSQVELGIEDVSSLCDLLIYDDKIERNTDGSYKATWQSVLSDQGRKADFPDLPGFLVLPEHLGFGLEEEAA